MSDRQPDPGSDDEGPIESPPEGSTCAEHPERPALATCPRCGSYACLGCWHHAVRRCHACLMRDPSAAAPPIPWEEPRRNVLVRWLGTILTAFRPTATAPAFARGDVTTPRSFFVTSFLPLAMAPGIIGYTHTMFFGPSFQFRLIGEPTGTAIAIDVFRAIGLSLLVSTATLLALAVPYVSLVRAYADKGHEAAPARLILYRGYLLPLALVLFHVLGMGLPLEPTDTAIAIVQLIGVLPLVLLVGGLRATARMASGVGPFASLATAIVPFVVMILVHVFVASALAPLMPAPEIAAGIERELRGGAP